MPKRTCTHPGCSRVNNARGLCLAHYAQWKHGTNPDVHAGPRVRRPAGLTHIEVFERTAKVHTADGCIEWRGGTRYGYGLIQSKVYGAIGAHRVAYLIAHGGVIPDGMVVCHRCDNPPCVNPEHLFLGRQADNVTDMMGKGRHSYGERHTAAKLTEAQVREIIARYARGGVGRPQLAREYGVSPGCIQGITERKRWRHLG